VVIDYNKESNMAHRCHILEPLFSTYAARPEHPMKNSAMFDEGFIVRIYANQNIPEAADSIFSTLEAAFFLFDLQHAQQNEIQK
jgi:hypothetical protein